MCAHIHLPNPIALCPVPPVASCELTCTYHYHIPPVYVACGHYAPNPIPPPPRVRGLPCSPCALTRWQYTTCQAVHNVPGSTPYDRQYTTCQVVHHMSDSTPHARQHITCQAVHHTAGSTPHVRYYTTHQAVHHMSDSTPHARQYITCQASGTSPGPHVMHITPLHLAGMDIATAPGRVLATVSVISFFSYAFLVGLVTNDIKVGPPPPPLKKHGPSSLPSIKLPPQHTPASTTTAHPGIHHHSSPRHPPPQ